MEEFLMEMVYRFFIASMMIKFDNTKVLPFDKTWLHCSYSSTLEGIFSISIDQVDANL
jgi:hypothetical protein